MSDSVRPTLRLKGPLRPGTDDAEIEELRRKLGEARREIAVLQRRLGADGDRPIDHPRQFRRRLADVCGSLPRGVVAQVTLTNLADILAEHGDRTADALLDHLAETLAGRVRATDRVGRVALGTFGLLLAHAEEDGARRKMDTLVRALEAVPFAHDGKEITLKLTHWVLPLQEGAENVLGLSETSL